MPASPVRSFLYLLLLGVMLFTLALVVRSGMLARKNPGLPINAGMREALAEERPELTTHDALVIADKYGNAHKQESGLRYIPRAQGTGDAHPHAGQQLTVNYELHLLDGTFIDSSAQHGKPFVFTLGQHQVIAAWEETFPNMRKGEKRTLIVPYWLGYGVSGQPPAIPPRATLVFEVELVDFK
ncbi:FKBP-type peptidyl-prolyl cis-trans isomerase [Horticoccus luteus]|uniref:Peptidyl-prolyl cis-trans isomerase n=1 Tax=Horticoccus luteus TaxID=2862869 RepID=A0A8F9TXR9_9BACT|nr:FKBP-type peptidyl-prolyl cis-trans isomerase [Horticoccus luteus]QYM79487.1 FKBP-type peptidyl-prolyl cis-trans isomerase [Horticoccus luteus]